MRSKHILSTVAFIAAFVFSTVLASFFIPIPQVLPVDYSVSNSNQPTSCFLRRKNFALGDKITAFIQKDENNGSGNDEAAGNFDWDDSATVTAYAESVEEYVDESSSMNANAFPSDFQAVWRKHMKAWRDYSTFLNKTAANMDDDNMSFEDFQKFENFHNGEINRTFKEVLRIGTSYGADIE